MNERIRELSEQAEKYADDNFRGEPTWSEAFESKFAELIVRECIDTVQRRYMGDNNREDMEVRRCVEDLKTHFGVAESKREQIDKAMQAAFKHGVDLSGKETP
jgi:hypothetical protein